MQSADPTQPLYLVAACFAPGDPALPERPSKFLLLITHSLDLTDQAVSKALLLRLKLFFLKGSAATPSSSGHWIGKFNPIELS